MLGRKKMQTTAGSCRVLRATDAIHPAPERLNGVDDGHPLRTELLLTNQPGVE